MDQEIEVKMQIYQYLRDEMIESIKYQNKVLISIIFLISTGISLSMQTSFNIILFAVTPIVFTTISLWLIHNNRIRKMGYYLQLLEDKINSDLKKPCVTWECWLLKEREKKLNAENIIQFLIFTLLILFAFISIWKIGSIELINIVQRKFFMGVYIIFLIILIIIAIISLFQNSNVEERTIELKKWDEEYYNNLKKYPEPDKESIS
ncbi:MAG: hypothetical protein O8C61_06680 [Candidatus Methanoperedens sp.]|nr:hypothetical protein [Candidatus Methanoperedens sp.]